jgi:HAD superfamily hydrolase (TIGR01509 family)
MFDEYLRERAEQKGEAFRPFDLATDYRLYVDGEPRFDGVRDFLRSRRIQLPEGTSDDPADVETVHGLGNRKNELVNRAIAELGVEPYVGTVQFIHQLRRNGFKIAVVTSSQNCDAVLRAAKLDDLFEVRVDGNLIQAQRLAGKPAPDTFLIAAKQLGVEPIRTVVIEDAISAPAPKIVHVLLLRGEQLPEALGHYAIQCPFSTAAELFGRNRLRGVIDEVFG